MSSSKIPNVSPPRMNPPTISSVISEISSFDIIPMRIVGRSNLKMGAKSISFIKLVSRDLAA